jgi:hypothetical protein
MQITFGWSCKDARREVSVNPSGCEGGPKVETDAVPVADRADGMTVAAALGVGGTGPEDLLYHGSDGYPLGMA